ncbi:MAG: MoxR family ATPase [Spirochaetales bacterium]|nr:MAG: MoxR family ATPase [Spirochaetales bacterium]
MDSVSQWAQQVIASVETVFFGKREVIEKLLVTLLCRGHVLLEDVPGMGKTILARALAASLGGRFSRIQCTPDLLPADILGVSIYSPKDGTFSFREGPIMANIVLVDEINRATPRTQSALLEATGEGQVSIEGKRRELPDPFFLMATENPVEFEGTFPLPEAQQDRFLISLGIGYPERLVEQRIVDSQRRLTHPVNDVTSVTEIEKVHTLQEQVVNVHVDQGVMDYISSLVEASRVHPNVRIGVSPRGTLALYKASQALAAIRGRDYVIPEDVKELCRPVFAKRLMLTSQATIRGVVADSVITALLDSVPTPVIPDQRS